MKRIKLDIPVLVNNILVNEKPHYHIKPVFFSYPVATNRKFDLAIHRFKKEVRSRFKGFELNRNNADQLLWYKFSPELNYELLQFNTTIQKKYYEGKIAYVHFTLEEKTFACIPAFDHFICMLKPNEKGKIQIGIQVEDIVKKLIKKQKDNWQSNDFDPAQYFVNKKEFITTIPLDVYVGEDSYDFEKRDANNIFSMFSDNSDFNGSVEIEIVGENLNEKYPSILKRAYYREALVKRLYDIIYQGKNTPIVLVGATGVGKHTLIEETIFRYLSQQYKKQAKHVPFSKLWTLDPNRLIAGMSIVGHWQKRLEAIIQFIRFPYPDHNISDKLVIDNPVAMFSIGRSARNDMTMSDLLRPYLEKRELQIVLIASPEEWKIIQENDRRFSDLFQVIRLEEPVREDAVKMILQKRLELESDNDCDITLQGIQQLLYIQRNYMYHKALPGSVIDLLEQLSVKYRFSILDAPQIRDEFRLLSGLKETFFDKSTAFEKDQVRKAISAELKGQKEAVDALVNVIHSVKARLNDPTKPYGSFMFIGPTGVGKTQAAKVLSKFLMGTDDALMRFDMNEYIDPYAVQRLIGDHNNPEGLLTGKVRYQPFGVLLFDEIEKAHRNVHDILLQVLDDGRLTDSLGRTVDFTNTIIIMTSNVGAREAASMLGFTGKKANAGSVYRKAVENLFRPEFINRIDQIVIFKPLELNHILEIAQLQIKELLKRDGFVRRTTILNVNPDALEWVARRGFDENMGGRALKRQIEKDLTALSAEQLIKSYSEDPIIMDIDLEKNKLVPYISTLTFQEPLADAWLPEVPNMKEGQIFLEKLYKKTERIERKLSKLQDNGPIKIDGKSSKTINWESYQILDQIRDTKDKVDQFLYDLENKKIQSAPAKTLRMRRAGMTNWIRKYNTEPLIDKWFQKDAIEEIFNSFQYDEDEFNQYQSTFIELVLDIHFYDLFVKALSKNKQDKITITFESCIEGQGKEEIEFLIKHYERMLTEMNKKFEVDEKNQTILIEGYNVLKLLEAEVGIHLFYKSHQNPLPIKFILRYFKNDKVKKSQSYQVIRIYDETKALTDLRTGYTNAANMTFAEFRLMLYAGMQ